MIYNLDAIKLTKSLDDNSVDLCIVDIPYGEVNRKSNGLRNLDKQDADIKTFDEKEFVEVLVPKVSGSIYIFCGTEQVSIIRKTMVELGLSTRLCIFEKSNPSPMNGQHIWLSSVECCVFGKKAGAIFNEHCKSAVWRFPTVRGKIHPTQKPLALMEYLVKTSSNENDLVYDPCCGSGTTLLAAKNLNRRYIGSDISQEYVTATIERLTNG
jgi:site-specific DNA-methyltransferase (adenine-specific)